jgi:PAS domain S-box-containing protein
MDPGGTVTTWNPGGEEIYGYHTDEIIGQHISRLYTIDVVASGDLDELLRVLPENGPCEAEELQVRKNGELFRGRVTISPLREPLGGHVGFAVSVSEEAGETSIASSVDSAEHRQGKHALIESEQALRDRETQYRAVVETLGDGFWVADLEGRLLEVNDAYVRRSGYSRKELLTMRVSDLEAQEDVQEAAAHIAEVVRIGSDRFDTRHVAKDGTVWPVEVTSTYCPLAGGRLFVFSRDIRSRIRSEFLLRTRLQLSDLVPHLGAEELVRTALDAIEAHTNSGMTCFHVVDPDQRHEPLHTLSTRALKNQPHATEAVTDHKLREAGIWAECIHAKTVIIHNDCPSPPHRGDLQQGSSNLVRHMAIPVLRDGLVVAILGLGSKPTDYTREDVEVAQELASITMDMLSRKQAENALQRSEERYRQLAENASDVIWVLDMETDRFRYMSPSAERLIGVSAEETLHWGMQEMLAPTSLEYLTALLPALVEEFREGRGTSHTLEIELNCKDGSTVWVEINSRLLVNEGNGHIEAHGISRDITERRRAVETRLRHLELQDQLAKIAASVPGAVHSLRMRTDGAVSFPFATEAIQDLLGISMEALARDADVLMSRIPPADARRLNELAAISARDLSPWHAEFEYAHPTNGQKWIETWSMPQAEPDGSTLWHGFMMDVTERKKAEVLLAEEAARRRILMEQSRDGIVVLDEDGKVYEANQTFAEMLGYSPEEVRELHVWDWDDQWNRAELLEIIRLVDSAGARMETRHRRKDGTHIDVEISSNSFLWGERKLVLCVCRDFSQRKRTERRLATQSAVNRALSESESLREAAPKIVEAICESEGWDFGAMWRVDGRAGVLRCVDLWHREGLSATELATATRALAPPHGDGLLGQVWASGAPILIPSVTEDSRFLRANLAQQTGLQCAIGFPILKDDEVIGVVDFLGRDIRDPDQTLLDLLGGIGAQIGQFLERKRAQEDVRRLISVSPSVIYLLKLDAGRAQLQWVSENIRELTGHEASETSAEWWAEGLHPDDRQRVLDTQPTPYEIEHQILEFRFRRKNGEYFWVRDEKRLLRDPQGIPIEVIGSWADISERVQLEEQLRQSQKMEAIGKLAGGVAHDFNNLLTVMQGNAELLLTMLPPGDPRRLYVGEIRDAGERAAALTRQLLAFGRKQVLEPKILDVNQVVCDTERMLRRLIGEDIVLTTVLSPSAALVRIDPAQIGQVLINLAVNARDAMPKGGRLTIESQTVELTEEYCRNHAEARPGWYTLLAMTDTGGGISPEAKERIFEPFFTTKEQGSGTGLGLATVFGIVKQSEGHIEVQSELGAGTSFKIYLPSIHGAGAASRPDRWPGAPQEGREAILLVEDEEAVRRIAKLALEAHGYAVVEAANGARAIEIAEERRHPIQLLLTDVVMPEMGGRQLAERLNEKFPDMKVIFMSGYTDDSAIRHGIIEEKAVFLQKPFSPAALAKKVRETLDGKR